MASVTVTINQGSLKGSIETTQDGFSYNQFLGIPFAKPPVGDLRFKPPQSPESWVGERDATVFDNQSHRAIQQDMISSTALGSEDCLYVNVYSPRLRNSKTLLPVMVHVHGGGFISGSGTDSAANGPDYLIENNVVIVSFNYRLDIFGFLNLGISNAAGNMGLKDQVKALEWVRDNISAFGGDSNNVTIFGPSAGSASVEYLVLSPLAKGLFHKAILQSGSSLNHWAIDYEPKLLINKVLNILQYKKSYNDIESVYQFLMKLPQIELLKAASKASRELSPNRLYFGFVPTIEKDFGNGDEFLTDLPYKILKEGNFSHVPMIRGFCDSEGILTTVFRPEAFKEVFENKTFTSAWAFEIDTEYNAQLLDAYSEPRKISNEPDQFALDFFTDLDFNAGIWNATKLMARKEVPIYFYLFTYDGGANAIKEMFNIKRKGAGHCDEMAYVLRFKGTMEVVEDKDILTKTRLTRMWTDFAKTSNPTPNASSQIPLWPKFTEESPLYLNIGKELSVENNYRPKSMTVFEEIYARYEK